MTYGQVKKAVLKLLNQYSVAGSLVADSYNNQQDYLNRMAPLVNDGVMEIATTARKIPVLLTLSEENGERLGKMVRYDLPEDFYQFKSGGTVVTCTDGHVLHTNLYRTQGKKYILVPADEAGEYTVEYYRYPALLGDDPADDEELDNDPITHRAVPYYVAAHLVIHDEAYLYQAYYNKYEDMLAKMTPAPFAEVTGVQDVYGGV